MNNECTVAGLVKQEACKGFYRVKSARENGGILQHIARMGCTVDRMMAKVVFGHLAGSRWQVCIL